MNQWDPNQLHALQAMLVFMPIVVLIFIIIAIIPYWMIWKKAGFSPWFSLLMFIPMVNLIMLYVLAFSEWKVMPVAQPTLGYPYPPSSLPPQA
jgi:uncharacterized membrane protein YhaH (DUF805 family)